MTQNNAINAPLPIAGNKGGTGQSSYVTGDMIYASATDTLAKLPIGIAGKQLTSTGSVPTWFNPSTDVYQFDDFFGACTNSTTGFTISTANSGGFSRNNVTSIQSNLHPGVWSTSSASSSTAISNIRQNSPSNGPFVLGGGSLSFTFLINIPILSTGTQRFLLELGMSETSTAAIVNGIYFSYTDSVNSGNWVLNTTAASVSTTANSSTAVTTNWTKVRIDVNAAGTSVAFFINDVQVTGSPLTTNIPTASIGPFLKVTKSIGTTARLVHVDYYQMYNQLTVSR